ncbi:hypothetical protein DFH11DRAFT_1548058, partial [Phellopilus nigrolimitatus]
MYPCLSYRIDYRVFPPRLKVSKLADSLSEAKENTNSAVMQRLLKNFLEYAFNDTWIPMDIGNNRAFPSIFAEVIFFEELPPKRGFVSIPIPLLEYGPLLTNSQARLAIRISLGQRSETALFVSELLAIILNFSDLQTKGRCARVSRSWCPIALDSLWHTLSSVVPLLQLLGDFTYREEGRGPDRRSCLTYTLPPTQKEWTRFQ